MAWYGQRSTALLLDSPPARDSQAQRLRTGCCPQGPGCATAPVCPRAARPPFSVPPGWGRSSPVRYLFKPGRDGNCWRQRRLARDAAARQARARSRRASGERRGRRGRGTEGSLAAHGALQSGARRAAGGTQCNAENVRGSAGPRGAGARREGGGNVPGETAGETAERDVGGS